MLEDRAGGEHTRASNRPPILLIQTAAQAPRAGATSSAPSAAKVPCLLGGCGSFQSADPRNPRRTDTYNTLQTFLGGLYVNDFNNFGRTWQVLVQAQPEFRTDPGDVNRFYVRTGGGDMVPLGTLATVKPDRRPRRSLSL